MSAKLAASIVTDDRVARYVAARCSAQLLPPFTVMGLERDGEIIAGVVFNSFTERDVEVTVAGERGAFSRTFLKSVGEYVFGIVNCTRISITTRQGSVCDIAQRLGAKMEGVKRDHYGPGQDAYLLGILKADWVFR